MAFLALIFVITVSIFFIKRSTDKFYKHNPDATFRDFYFGNKYAIKTVNGKKVKILINWEY